MKTIKTVLALVASAVSLFGFAGEVTWTSWSDLSAGDTAVIPSGTTATVTESDIAKVNTLAGIRLDAEDSTIRFSSSASSDELTLNKPVSGPGKFEVLNCGRLTIAVDNSSFTGPFLFSNSLVRVMNNRALSYGNKVTVFANSSRCASSVYALQINAAGVYNNDIETHSGTYRVYTHSAITNLGHFAGYGYVHLMGPTSGTSAFMGGLSVAEEGGSSTLYLLNNLRLAGDFSGTFCSIGDITIDESVQNSALGAWQVSGTLRCTAANHFGTGISLLFGRNGNPYGRLELNGFNQQFGTFSNYSDAKTAAGAFKINSTAPATITFRGTGYHNLKAAVTGPVSICLDQITANAFNIGAGDWTTDGEITVKNGSLNIMEGFNAPNLRKITVMPNTDGEGKRISSPHLAFNSSNISLENTVINSYSSGLSYLGSGMAPILCKTDVYPEICTFQVEGGDYYAPGQYGASGALYYVINGSDSSAKGKLVVLTGMPYALSAEATWTGATDTDILKAANWDALPDWKTGWPKLTFSAGTEAAIGVATNVWGIGLTSASGFTLSGEGSFTVGEAGLTFGSTESAAYTVNVPLHFKKGFTRELAAGQTITLGGNLTSEADIEPIVFTSAETTAANMPTVILNGNNSGLLTKMYFTNVMVKASNPWALGSATEGTHFSAANSARLRLTENVSPVTNNAALAIAGSLGQYSFTGKSGEKVVMNGPVYCYAASIREMSLTCYGGLYGVTRNGNGQALYAQSSTVNVYEVPMDMGTHIFHGEGGTVNLYVAGNKWANYELYANTLNTHVDDALNGGVLVGYEGKGKLDLKGKDQTLTSLSVNTKITESVPKTRVLLVDSTAVGHLAMTANNATWPIRFQGKSSPRMAKADTTVNLIRQDSPTTGEIDVSAGTLVIKWDATFKSVKDIKISGGTLKVDATAGADVFGGSSSSALLAITGEGKLDIGEGQDVVVDQFTLAGVGGKAKGKYCSQAAKDNGAEGTVLDCLSGLGTLTVRRNYGIGLIIMFR